jgi:PAS domain S-box-containing protein
MYSFLHLITHPGLWLRNLHIKMKIIVVTMLISAVTLTSAMTIVYFYGSSQLEQNLLKMAKSDAQNLAYHARGPVTSADDGAALEALEVLKGKKEVIKAWVRDRDGRLMAVYPEDAELDSGNVSPRESQVFEGGCIRTYALVVDGDGAIGGVYIEESIESVARQKRLIQMMATTLVLFSLLLSLILSSILQKLISKPLMKLSVIARRITESNNFNLRVSSDINDEIGRLAEDFNAMVEALGERDELLRRGEKNYRELVQNVRAIIIQMNTDAEIIFANEFALEFFGYSEDEFVGKSVIGTMVPETSSAGEDLKGLIERIFANPDEYVEVVNENVCSDGSRVWVAWRNRLIRNEDGEPMGILTVGLDITAQKESEEEVQRSAIRFKALVEQSLTGIYIFAQDRFKYVNPGFCRIFGYDEQEIMETLRPQDVVKRAERERANENIRKRLSGEVESVHYIAEGKHKDGRPLWIEIHGTHIELDGEQLIAGTVLDITERKIANDEIKKNDERLARAFDNIPDVIVLYDKNLRIQYINNATVSVSGRDAESFIGKTDREIWPEEIYSKYMPSLERALETGEITFVEADLDIDGVSKMIVQITCVPLLDSEGEVREVIGVTHDITEQVKAEAEIIKLNLSLEQRIEDRTRQLAAANKELEAFSYSVSHDLRAPLRHIASFVDLLTRHMQGNIDEKGTRYLGIIRNSATQMGQLIEELLAFSKLGRDVFNAEPTNLNQLLESVLAGCQKAIGDRRVEWQIAELPDVLCDRMALGQALTNMVDNALKYSQSRSVIRIQIGYKCEDRENVAFYIKDNGVGFDMGYADKLFGVFQRLHSQEEYEGSGVGLAIVKRVIEKHGGRVWAESEVDVGSTFYFTMPLVK